MARKNSSGDARRPASRATKSKSKSTGRKGAPIVAIGASAGGLEAATALFRALPADTGMAFVFIQHLAPQHESMLARLLARATSMPVNDIERPTVPKPNHVYVIAPNMDLTIAGGRLNVSKQSAKGMRHLPVDEFFNSLAADQGRRSIGIVLSGLGSDGTLGLEAIKAAGGVTFAQDEATARQSGMPGSAAASGCVDFILPPEGIAEELTQISRHPYLAETVDKEPEFSEDILRKLFAAVSALTGVDFTGYRRSTVVRRVERRMALRRIETVEQYAAQAIKDPAELRALFADVLIHVTGFFREPEVFEALKASVFSTLLNGRMADDPVRVWVPGCATGEEAYSLAMALLECVVEPQGPRPALQIFGTDLSEPAVEKARKGLYQEAALKGVSAVRRKRFFTKVEEGYQIGKGVRDVCIFARHDLIKDPPFSKMDLVSCRNVLIYLGRDVQKRVAQTIHYALNPGGHLLLGRSETLEAHPLLFSLVDAKHKIYQRKATAAPPRIPDTPGRPAYTPPRTQRDTPVVFDLHKEVARILNERYLPAAVVVDADLHILQFHGDISPYLKPQPGPAELHLLKMVRDEFAMDLRMLLQRAKNPGLPKTSVIKFRIGGTMRETKVEVIPVEGRNAHAKSGAKWDYLVVFADTKPPQAASPSAAKASPRDSTSSRYKAESDKLRQDLAATRVFLRSAIEDSEATNEELRAANEEILSNNEELQSTNEELETAKEEMQSSNEELTTLNEELRSRNEELAQLLNDLNNLLTGIEIPIVIIGPDQRIRHFTPPAEKLLNLQNGDLGRLVAQIRPQIDLPDLTALVEDAMNTGQGIEREVRDRSGRWYLLRVRQYQSAAGVRGVLLVLVDIDAIKRSMEHLRDAQDYASGIVETVPEPLVVLDHHFHVATANPAFYRMFQTKPEDTEHRDLFSLFNGVWDIAELRLALAETARSSRPFSGFEVNVMFPSQGRKRVLLSGRPITPGDHQPELILFVIEDVTLQREAEEARDSGSMIRALFDSSPRANVAVDASGRIVLSNAETERLFGYSESELVGQPVTNLMPARSRPVHDGYLASYFAKPSPRLLGRDVMARRKDGSEFPVEIYATHVRTKNGMLAVAFVTDVTERRKAEEMIKQKDAAIQKSHEEMRALATGLLTAQEDERRRLSRELHDDLNQKLAMLVVEVESLEKNTAKKAPESSEELSNQLRSIRNRVETISDTVQRTAHQLHPSVIEHLGLISALRSLCSDLHAQEMLDTSLVYRNVPEQLNESIALCLYRVAQEGLRNVVKHAGVREARLTLVGSKDKIRLTINDMGKGFHPDGVNDHHGLGIISMEERVRLVNGSLSIVSQPQEGTRVEVRIPLDGDRRAERERERERERVKKQ